MTDKKFLVIEKFLIENEVERDTIRFASLPQDVLRFVESPLLVTPHVGHRRRFAPPRGKILHTLVSLTSLEGVYEDWHFDDYDYIVVAGQHQVESFERLAARRPALRGKYLLPFGYPKLECAMQEASFLAPPNEQISWVVYAPTHTYSVNKHLTSLPLFGMAIVDSLLDADIGVVFRPHPESFRGSERIVVEKIIAKHGANPLFELDRSANYIEIYSKTNLMITDLSGTGFTYAFTFARPVVFFAHNSVAEHGFKGLQFESRECIGTVVRTIEQFGIAVAQMLEQRTARSRSITQFRDEILFPCVEPGARVARAIDTICEGGVESEWIQL